MIILRFSKLLSCLCYISEAKNRPWRLGGTALFTLMNDPAEGKAEGTVLNQHFITDL